MRPFLRCWAAMRWRTSFLRGQRRASRSPVRRSRPAAACWRGSRPGQEPTEHLLRELLDEDLQGLPLTLLVPDAGSLRNETLRRFCEKNPDVPVLLDGDARTAETAARQTFAEAGKLPLLVVLRGPLTAVYAVSGYHGRQCGAGPARLAGGAAVTELRIVRSRRKTLALQVLPTGEIVARAPCACRSGISMPLPSSMRHGSRQPWPAPERGAGPHSRRAS